MIGDPVVPVYCDTPGCGYYDEFGLTPTAKRGWDDRELEAEIERAGWTIEGDNTYCPNCSEERKEPPQE